MAHDVFVSYSTKDKSTADAICAALEANGIRCWIAPRDILPGSDWGESIIDAIHACRAMVLVFSGNSNASSQIKREIERAVNACIPVLPFRIEDVLPSKTLEYFISTQHWLDALTPPLEQHLQYLATTMRAILAQKVDGSEEEVREPQLKPHPAAAAPEPPPVAPPPPPVVPYQETARAQKGILPWIIGGVALVALVGVAGGYYWSKSGDSRPSQPPITVSAKREPKPPPQEATIFKSFNVYLVANGPTAPTEFAVSSATNITHIMTYHYNGGSGSPPGEIFLMHADGKVYGPWTATGANNNTYWNVYPNTVIKPGRYTVIVSNPATWSYNSASGNAGFVLVE